MPPDGPRSSGRLSLRFEDVTQDGRLVLEALPTALGPTVWRGLLDKTQGLRACQAQGIFPILSRIMLEGTVGPFSANNRLEGAGTYRFSRTDDGRFMLDVWTDLFAPIGRTHGPSSDGPPVLAGRILAEHVLTRPFAPAGERRVTSLDFEGAPTTGEMRRAPPPFESVAAMPADAIALEAAPRIDPVPIVFGIFHTDGNMHVNSLAYLRVLEEAALRRFVELGRGSQVLGRGIDIAYRKPCFAGQTMHVVQQAFEIGGKLGISSVLVDASKIVDGRVPPDLRPNIFARMTFER